MNLELLASDVKCSDCGHECGVRVEPRQWHEVEGHLVSNVGAVFMPSQAFVRGGRRFFCSACADVRRVNGQVFPAFVPFEKREISL